MLFIEVRGTPKLSESDIPVILELRRSGLTYKEIAARFSVRDLTIRSVCLGLTWKHLNLETVEIKMTAKGSRSHLSKLTEAEVSEVLRLWSQGWTLKALAERFGITKSGVCRIVNRNRWSHVV